MGKNLETVQGTNLREPRFVTPAIAEFVRQAEVVKGLQKVDALRQEFNISKKKNIGYADFDIGGQKWTRAGHSSEVSKDGTAPVPERHFFKTTKDGYERAFDSEVKISEEFVAKYAN